MYVSIYAPETSIPRLLADAWAKAFGLHGHNVTVDSYPQPEHPHETELAMEIGTRLIGSNLGFPIIHYVYDPVDSIPGEWINAFGRGHIFLFADYDSYIRAHRQGLRLCEYVPVGWDSDAPLPTEITKVYDVGFFGDPSPKAKDIITDILGSGKKWTLGIYGNAEEWRKTPFFDYFAGEIPAFTAELFVLLNKCRIVLDDPNHNRPSIVFVNACASEALALCPGSSDRMDLFLNDEGHPWSECMFNRDDCKTAGLIHEFLWNGDAFTHTKAHQKNAIGEPDVLPRRITTDLMVAEHRYNRMSDRFDYLWWILESKQILENARRVCPQENLVQMDINDPVASITLHYLKPGNWRTFDIAQNGPSKATMEELPTILRIAARRIEAQLEKGSFEESIYISRSVQDKERESIDSSTSAL